MMRVLIPSNNHDFVVHWAKTYAQAGCDVVVGINNFHFCTGHFDIIHHQWPEELTGWRVPSKRESQQIIARMDFWRERAKVIASVNNLMPHGYENDLRMAEYVEAFYNRCHVVTHFSKISEKLFNKAFKVDESVVQIVTPMFNYEFVLHKQKARGEDRLALKLDSKAFIVLVFGTIRNWKEVKLIQQAFARARIKRKQLLVAGNFYGGGGSKLVKGIKRRMWRFWSFRYKARTAAGYVADEEIYRYMDSADVVVVPRLIDMNSAVPVLAMTFGKVVVAPNHGAFPEWLQGTGNFLYKSGDPGSLARALEDSASANRGLIGSENRALALTWRWDAVIDACLSAVSAGQNVRSAAQARDVAGNAKPG